MSTSSAAATVVSNDISAYVGEDKTLLVTVKQDGVKKDMTGADIFFTVRLRVTDPDPAVLSIDSISQPAQAFVLLPQSDTDKLGKLQINILDTDTVAVTAGEYFYDIWIKLGGLKNSIKFAKIVLKQPITTTIP